MMVVKNGSDLFSHAFFDGPHAGSEVGDSCLLKLVPETVEVPRSVAEEMAAGGTTLEYRDAYGGLVSASEVWIVWVSW